MEFEVDIAMFALNDFKERQKLVVAEGNLTEHSMVLPEIMSVDASVHRTKVEDRRKGGFPTISTMPSPRSHGPDGEFEVVRACLLADISEFAAEMRANHQSNTTAYSFVWQDYEAQANGLLAGMLPPDSGAFLQNVDKLNDEDILRHWSRPHKPLPEFRHAADTICVEREFMGSTLLLRHLQEINESFGAELKEIEKRSNFEAALREAISKAYSVPTTKARQQKDLISGRNVFDGVAQVYNSLEAWKKPIFVLLLKLVAEHEQDAAAITAKLGEIVDRSLHCPQVQVKSFQLLLCHTSRLLKKRGSRRGGGHASAAPLAAAAEEKHCDGECSNGNLEDFGPALERFLECFEDFLDDHKESAFNASFQEPARFLFELGGYDHWMKDNVDTHGNNWYIALLNASLNVHIPLMAAYWDNFPNVTIDHWAGLKDEAWEHFRSPEHFGNGHRGIPGLRRGGASLIKRKVSPHQYPEGNGEIRTAAIFANSAVAPHGDPNLREDLQCHVERFAYFFSRDFFVRKAFETLNSEFKPEHAGFRKACETLFQIYKAEQGAIEDDSFIEHCYQDEMFTTLDIDKTERFFVWLAVLKPSASMEPLRPAYSFAASANMKKPYAEARLEEKEAEEPPAMVMGEKRIIISQEEKRINDALQAAMRERDNAAIRRLMRERGEISARRGLVAAASS